MTGRRYYKKDWEESYYIFDSNTISEDEFEEDIEYEGYDIFGYSLTGSEIIDLLNENEQLKQRINSRLHFYRGLYESTNDKVVERVIEDLEDILKR